jgi:peptidoglycan/LPS O-acetylase OafA/YrhL
MDIPAGIATGPRMTTIGSALDRNKGFGPGFDFMRIFLALSILCWHCGLVAVSDSWAAVQRLWFVEYSLVPMFFALSGFLITGSGLRLSLGNFLINRGLRIVPALALEIAFSALLIGPLFTSLPWHDYFTSPMFLAYLLNIVGFIHFYLPGVFTHHPSTVVNASLWTIPYELICYVLMAVLILTGGLRRARVVAAAAFGLMVMAVIVRSIPGMEVTFDNQGTTLFDKTIRFLFTGEQARLLPCFLLGVLSYQIRHHLPYDRRLFALGLAACLLAAVLGSFGLMDNASFRIVMLPVLVYITVFVGVTPIPKLPVFSRGDYSYGLYLYHMPFQQIIYALIPGLSWVALFALSAPLATLVAMFSWHGVEKPILRLRKRFSFVARERGAADPQTSPPFRVTLADTVGGPRLSPEAD